MARCEFRKKYPRKLMGGRNPDAPLMITFGQLFEFEERTIDLQNALNYLKLLDPLLEIAQSLASAIENGDLEKQDANLVRLSSYFVENPDIREDYAS